MIDENRLRSRFFLPALFLNSETFLALFLQVFITEDRFVTGAGWLYSQANSHHLGPFDLVQVVPAYIKGVIVLSQANICGLEFICASCTKRMDTPLDNLHEASI